MQNLRTRVSAVQQQEPQNNEAGDASLEQIKKRLAPPVKSHQKDKDAPSLNRNDYKKEQPAQDPRGVRKEALKQKDLHTSLPKNDYHQVSHSQRIRSRPDSTTRKVAEAEALDAITENAAVQEIY